MTLLACSLYSIVNVMKASGCDVSDWMLHGHQETIKVRLPAIIHVLVSSSSSMYCQECQEETVEEALS